ncbi:MAG TPA: NADH-ubiquinone oxidoreductase-F iron-sulfur binding region domain-containing protein [Amaricoccus sp.]|uniref:NADH-ubiquinone oxidoreductase-F iron-sulfur binding region domain-containing protein n=1 Tax=Amaricoccus sp. TaxID=1872485 RepID=UPI002CA3B71C|nr:NADH-ubiquinone oxidoreductase-F iron-sulfur binding region domain-containing protein [Amaricoccus sp.]HMQ94771.1 NADH-ubiquinone oxidoreductase-F iron-sulfur binding region domain-containing protein [Amaricoccus sp.]HMR37586.1 NADH-ubiquinone oxidoreductase-F iron-sulfur binding region domain-containing protein [Paracoccus sp. (in: a-proteobacteria)]HMR53284.1 NADH-ubiquinone oxidoreductase-F iron-sulfur binding region domain-containing protein [Amaricoccus sp.]HMU00253.1 NADH-ubiquinone ox
MKIFVPMDSAAKALGAEAVVAALRAAAPDAEIVRTGSRGMIWLEPLVEVEIDGVRHGFGPAEPSDAVGIVDGTSDKALGPVADLDWMRRQTRLTFARVGVIDPLSLADFEVHGGLAGLRRALGMTGQEIVDEVKASGLRGRGGAGFPTGIKWQTVHDTEAPKKYIICNADEGDSGTFADRMIMEGDPFTLIEGMAIAGIGVGATRGYVYLRSEYPDAIAVMCRAVELAREAGILGTDVLGSGQAFDMEIRKGAGAYVCGEETSLLNSLEGKRGVVRAKPPLPALEGFLGRPTIVNNVISLATVPVIFEKGAQNYAEFGLGRSRGTVTLQVAGNVARGGLFETAFGVTLGEVVIDLGGGTASGRPVKAVQVGGPLGAYMPVSKFDTPIGYEEFDRQGGLIGHAGMTVFDDTTDMLGMARFAMEFCAIESCGKCTPCRIGAVRGVETIDRIAEGDAAALPLLTDLCETMKDGSLCALGSFTPYPVLSAVTHFPDDFARLKEAAE